MKTYEIKVAVVGRTTIEVQAISPEHARAAAEAMWHNKKEGRTYIHDLDPIAVEIISEKESYRPELKEIRDMVLAGKVVFCHKSEGKLGTYDTTNANGFDCVAHGACDGRIIVANAYCEYVDVAANDENAFYRACMESNIFRHKIEE